MILGINTSHDAAFCILDDNGRPLYVLEEERFNRVKHSGFCSTVSLDVLLEEGFLDPDRVTDLAYSFEMGEDAEARLLRQCEANVQAAFGSDTLDKARKYFHQPERNFSLINGLGLTTSFEGVLKRLRSLFPRASESSYMHHLCHAASAYYPSPFRSAAVLIVDGSGRLETTTIWAASESGLELAERTDLPHSLGILYWLFSSYVGLEEGQTMGLAPYGTPKYADLIRDDILEIGPRGRLRFKAPIVFWFDMDSEYALSVITEVLGAPPRSPAEPLSQFHADVAASIQCVTEGALVHLAAVAREITGEESLCLAGGVIQNCVANGRVLQSALFKDVWIQPMANDAGTSLGAALCRYHLGRSPISERWQMTTAQLGLGYDSAFVRRCLIQVNIPYAEVSQPASSAAQWIAEGRSVGWFQQRAEVGPRALGGRSILADPRGSFTPFWLNDIKLRHPWRPFAPSVVVESATEFFILDVSSPYMIVSLPVRDEARSTVPAVCHIDGSARPQTVSQSAAPHFHQLIGAFQRLTGTPLVLNTSFNLRGEPIVQHPIDAIRDFAISSLQSLVIENIAVESKNVLPDRIRSALSACNFVSLYFQLLESQTPVRLINHPRLTGSERIRVDRCLAILGWLGIPCRVCSAEELAHALKRDSNFTLLCPSPHRDAGILASYSAEVLQRLSVVFLDSHMYPARGSAFELVTTVAANCKSLRNKAAGKRVVVWSTSGWEEEICACLISADVDVSGVIGKISSPESQIHPHSRNMSLMELEAAASTIFLVVSNDIMDTQKAYLRRCGFHSGVGYVVWET